MCGCVSEPVPGNRGSGVVGAGGPRLCVHQTEMLASAFAHRSSHSSDPAKHTIT